MEFIIDDTNNARNAAFLNKTKNQAKNLFKLAKQNELNIAIKNLAQAQEILAQINGFPDWHALEATISNAPKNALQNSFTVTNLVENIENHLVFEKINNVPYTKDIDKCSDNATSFVSVEFLPNSYEDFNNLINNLLIATNFQYNMGFHKINVFISQQPIEKQHVKTVQFFNYNDSLGLTKEQFEEFFKINVTPHFNIESEYRMRILFSIETNIDMLDQHINFCQIFNKPEFSDYLLLLNELSDLNYNLIQNKKNNYSNLSITSTYKTDGIYRSLPLLVNNFFSKNTHAIKSGKEGHINYLFNHDKWILALKSLSERKHNWQLDFRLGTNVGASIFSFYHSENLDKKIQHNNEKYLTGLYNSLINSDLSLQKIDMFEYLPLSKGNLPWKSGIPLINHTDKIIEYFQPYSTFQTSYNTLIFAKPGSGKSLWMNTLNMAHVFSPNATKLPKIGIVDIGPSSAPFLSLIKSGLPQKDKNLVQYHRLKMTDEYCTNIFDTQLGCRFPTVYENELLINFISLLNIDITTNLVITGMVGLIKNVIENTYLQFSDFKTPKHYEKGINKQIDDCIAELNISLDNRTSWWEVVDQLFIANKINDAKIAQRHAVPLLSDLVISDKVRDIYSSVKVATGETLIDYFNRSITDALIHYKILTKPTIFDISNARIISLDLDEVAKSGGMKSDRQTAVMYMLARYILGKDKLAPETVNEMLYPPNLTLPENIPVAKYKLYYQKIFNEAKEDYKILCYDEFHRVAQSEPIKNQLLTDMRASRKYGCSIIIASQSLNDFNTDMTDLATSVFIMDSGNSNEIQDMVRIFNLNYKEKQLLKYIHGPRNGSSGVMLAKISATENVYSKLISTPYNPFLLSALNTSSEDILLRDNLATIVGHLNAVRHMTKYYPNGIKKIVELKKQNMIKEDKTFEIDTVIKELMSEIILKEYKDI